MGNLNLMSFVMFYVLWNYNALPSQCFQDLPKMVAIKDADFSDVDAVFCCLPHGTTQVVSSLPCIS